MESNRDGPERSLNRGKRTFSEAIVQGAPSSHANIIANELEEVLPAATRAKADEFSEVDMLRSELENCRKAFTTEREVRVSQVSFLLNLIRQSFELYNAPESARQAVNEIERLLI